MSVSFRNLTMAKLINKTKYFKMAKFTTYEWTNFEMAHPILNLNFSKNLSDILNKIHIFKYLRYGENSLKNEG